jgi:hypothetical protein
MALRTYSRAAFSNVFTAANHEGGQRALLSWPAERPTSSSERILSLDVDDTVHTVTFPKKASPRLTFAFASGLLSEDPSNGFEKNS